MISKVKVTIWKDKKRWTVTYRSGRTRNFEREEKVPKTVKQFILTHTAEVKAFDVCVQLIYEEVN